MLHPILTDNMLERVIVQKRGEGSRYKVVVSRWSLVFRIDKEFFIGRWRKVEA